MLSSTLRHSSWIAVLSDGPISRRFKLTEQIQITQQIRADKQLQPHKHLVLAYHSPPHRTGGHAWEQLVGWAKSLLQVGEMAEAERWRQALELSERTLDLGFRALQAAGFQIQWQGDQLRIPSFAAPSPLDAAPHELVDLVTGFQIAVEEEDFQRRYFYDVGVEEIATILHLHR